MYFPRFLTGASSPIPAYATSSASPPPTPMSVVPPIATSILCANPTTKDPTATKTAPINATYRRPIKSDMDPAKGAIAAVARVFAIPNQATILDPPRSAIVYAKISEIYRQCTKGTGNEKKRRRRYGE